MRLLVRDTEALNHMRFLNASPLIAAMWALPVEFDFEAVEAKWDEEDAKAEEEAAKNDG